MTPLPNRLPCENCGGVMIPICPACGDYCTDPYEENSMVAQVRVVTAERDAAVAALREVVEAWWADEPWDETGQGGYVKWEAAIEKARKLCP